MNEKWKGKDPLNSSHASQLPIFFCQCIILISRQDSGDNDDLDEISEQTQRTSRSRYGDKFQKVKIPRD